MAAKLYDGNKEHAVGEIFIREGTTEITNSEFNNCKKLEKIILPDSVTSIGDWAFNYCSNLTEIKFPANLISIGYQAFGDCWRLEKITYHKKTEDLLKNYLSSKWNMLEKIVIDEKTSKVKSEGIEELFAEAKKCDPDAILRLKNFIKRGQGLIASLYYDGNKKNAVGAIILSEDITAIDAYEFKDCDQLEKIILPESLLKIYDNAFEGCTALKEINLPENLTSIGEEAFKDCYNLKEIIFGKNLTSIDRYAFMYCDGLTKIAYHKKTEEILKKCFGRKQWDTLEKIVVED